MASSVSMAPASDPSWRSGVRGAYVAAGWLLILLWTVAMTLGLVAPDPTVASAGYGLAMLFLLLFALAHGAGRYGWRTIALFLTIAVVVTNLYENLSIETGFPFGRFHHTAAMGPKVFNVPVIVGPSYFSAGYLAWTLAEILLGRARSAWGTPVIAAFVVSAWDLCVDAIGSTVKGQWVYTEPGGYFGVPLSNFLGWLLTTWTVFQIFALLRPAVAPQPLAYRLQAPILWAAMALVYPAMHLAAGPAADTAVVGGGWRAGDVYETAAIVSLFTMLFVAVLGVLIVVGDRKAARGAGAAR